jgi:peptide deformylase
MKIVQYPHPALRHPARPVQAIDDELRRIVGEMLDLMYANKGLGLAAPQVALPYRVFVCNVSGDASDKQDEHVYINPTMLERKGPMVEAEEGCLSFPGLYQKVRRRKQVKVHAYNERGEPFERDLSDLEARLVQHETDHLDGKLFIDYFGVIARMSSRGMLADFEKQYRRAQERQEIPSDAQIERILKELENRQNGANVPAL